MKLTDHFSLEEFTFSNTARKLNIDNNIPRSYIPNVIALCVNVLEPLREFAQEPIIINSGYRCRSLNIAVGGVVNSQHLTAKAADIKISSIHTGRIWFEWIRRNCEFDQLIWEHNSKSYWIHVSFSATNRKQVIDYSFEV